MSSHSAAQSTTPLADIRAFNMGMITLRATLDATLEETLIAAGLGLPAQRRIEPYRSGMVGWMSPDELIILAPQDTVTPLMTQLSSALTGRHHMIVDVSDARAVFRIDGPEAAHALAKLSPVDLLDGAFPRGELRRTRLAQVPAAFWCDETGFTLICFRSVAQYVHDVLNTAARPGTGL